MSKSLMIYYSLTGNTEYIATIIKNEINCEVLHLQLEKELSSNGWMKILKGGYMAFTRQKPALKPYKIELSDYETIILGTPVWAGTFAPAFRTLFEQQSFFNKKIAIFLCSGSKGSVPPALGKLKEALPENQFLESIEFIDPIQSNPNYEKKAREWAKGINS
jgi:flavodoxin